MVLARAFECSHVDRDVAALTRRPHPLALRASVRIARTGNAAGGARAARSGRARTAARPQAIRPALPPRPRGARRASPTRWASPAAKRSWRSGRGAARSPTCSRRAPDASSRSRWTAISSRTCATRYAGSPHVRSSRPTCWRSSSARSPAPAVRARRQRAVLHHHADSLSRPASRRARTRAVYLVQREVAERLAAPPGGKEYGALSVNVQAVARAEVLLRVPPGAFRRRRKVDSAVMRVTPRPDPVVAPEQERRFRTFVQAAFGMRRKQMRTRGAHRGRADARKRRRDARRGRRRSRRATGDARPRSVRARRARAARPRRARGRAVGRAVGRPSGEPSSGVAEADDGGDGGAAELPRPDPVA